MEDDDLSPLEKGSCDRDDVTIGQTHIENGGVDIGFGQKSQTFPDAGDRTDDFAIGVLHGARQGKGDELLVFGNQNAGRASMADLRRLVWVGAPLTLCQMADTRERDSPPVLFPAGHGSGDA
jgi:hypothetical protein